MRGTHGPYLNGHLMSGTHGPCPNKKNILHILLFATGNIAQSIH
jgi:hypothetical protein